jgi:ABC-type multidrug transport system fused ATPase/permease subunit
VYVRQEPTLFATTIIENIKYGNPTATQQQVEDAAKLANAHDFIMNFPEGYNTHVGHKGSQLSGGQKQRIAICRCLVGSPQILLLDEATSALDAESELVVQDALDNIIATKTITTIIVAHRLSTIRNVDTINVIVNGQLKESGTHEQLMNITADGGGYYRKLVLKQDQVEHGNNNNNNNNNMPPSSISNSNISATGIPPPSPSLSNVSDSESDSEMNDTKNNISTTIQPNTSTQQSFTLSDVDAKLPLKYNDNNKVIVQLQDGSNASAANGSTNSTSAVTAPIHLEFKDVTFAYPTRPRKIILNGFNLQIKQGQTVALCGPSGGGKSTTVGLLERFYDPLSGSIEYQGINVREVNVHWYRSQIGYVGQEPVLFNDTIANNISFGCPFPVTRKDIIEATKQANAYDFIMNFDKKFDTLVGESGAHLSGGQKQRIGT